MDYSKLLLSYILPVYIDNEKNRDLQDLLSRYEQYADDVLDRMQFIIVDDGSPIPVSLNPIPKLNLQILRIRENIPWNQPGARNLGVVKSRTSKLVLTDLDHCFPERLLRSLILCKEPKKLYKFKREDVNGKVIKSHRNSFFCTKSLFFRGLGYDEEFCGNYGHDDTMFINTMRKMGLSERYFTRFVKIRLWKERKDEAHSLKRDVQVNTKLLERKTSQLAKDLWSSHSRLFLNFTWGDVLEVERA